jgi:DNA-binding LacI/PurR family transcriptional regulator
MRLCNRLHDECNPPNRNELGTKRGHLPLCPGMGLRVRVVCRRRDLATLMRSRHRGHDLRSRTPRRVLAAIDRLGYTRTAAAKNLRTRPAAVFCFSDELAMGARQVARRRGLRIPDQLSLVGFDDIRFASSMDPPLTTIAQPMRAIGEGSQ